LTGPSHACLLTGLTPLGHGFRDNGGYALPKSVGTAAEDFKAAGYRTAAFVSGFPLDRRFGLDRGFDVYDDAFERAPGLHFEFPERRADRVVGAALAWLGRTPGPAFLWVHFYDPHAPYDPPEAFREADAYRGEVAFADAMLGRLLEAWERRPEPSLVAVTSDHGEAFGEHGEVSHGLFVYDTTLHVPLVLRGAGIASARRVGERVGIVDLAATLAGLVGAERLPGRSLKPFLEPGQAATGAEAPLYAETLAPRLDFGWSELRSWREHGLKYVEAPRRELYDLDSDPDESTNLADTRGDAASRLAAALGAELQRLGNVESARAPDPQAAERLRALGYAQGFSGRGSAVDPKDRVEVARLIAQATGPFAGPREVIAAYSDIARRDPGNPLVNFRIADALLRSGRAAEAVPFFRQVTATRPRSADPYVGLATACLQIGHADEARQALRQALEADPKSGQAHYNLGELARAGGDLTEARAQYEAARTDPATRERAEARLAALPQRAGKRR
jgi:arylsulfatase A-like enzyme